MSILEPPQPKIVQDHSEILSASLEDLIRQKARVEFLSREARNVIEHVRNSNSPNVGSHLY